MTEYAKAEDIKPEIATRAFSLTSMDPEGRGKRAVADYVSDVNNIGAGMEALATTDDGRAVVAEEMARFKAGYLTKTITHLLALSRCASPMVTGPANFPVDRNRKRNESADRRFRELIEFRDRAVDSMKKRIAETRTPDEKLDADWGPLRADILSSLKTIEGIDKGTEPYNRALFVGSICGKIERAAANGEVVIVNRALGLILDYNSAHKKPAVSARHKVWGMGAKAEAAVRAHDAKVGRDAETVLSHPKVDVINNFPEERVQLIFPGKPTPEVRDRLRSSGFVWSPSQGAWQRKNTPNGLSAAKFLFAELTKETA